jgi:phage gpG-like protein
VISSRKVTDKPFITINVIELLHASTKDKRLIKAMTPIIKQEAVKREIGQRVIDAILGRTLEGIDKNSKNFKGYSKTYRESTTFKIYKGKQRNVDLKLTGEMQADFDVRSVATNTVTIGFTNEMQGVKARGHIEGANYLPKRDFMGLPQQDMIKIMQDVVKEYESENLINELQYVTNVNKKLKVTNVGNNAEINIEEE